VIQGLRLEDVNALPDAAAVALLLHCCGSMRWARLMAGKRPFTSIAHVAGEADQVWASLRAEDWLEAFAAHPRIGDSVTGAGARDMPGGLTRGDGEIPLLEWGPGAEQSRVSSAGSDVRDRLAAANREYEARFGFMFIVCATGKSAEEMLAALERRMTNSPGDELVIAAAEQGEITRLRLGRLLAG
jgi:2-oxo-4-hydroxy-4-carboxy-5-ureidoimidazoline decarboxylase